MSLPSLNNPLYPLQYRMYGASILRATTARYRAGYVAVNASAIILIGNIPGTFLWDPEAGETADGGAFAGFLATVAVSVLAFLAVQVCWSAAAAAAAAAVAGGRAASLLVWVASRAERISPPLLCDPGWVV